ncbi:hypothetical protein BHE17_04735 [Planococcus maritimus]|uniref:hypothetical protein n=1 Tax=Planococcus maritimus TaxID=192421 RepID=UPI00084BD984|nr:hypothetical protein [Planococcus maritimus]OED31782.1 hypothetical protein BHE17_04735 [Planococcus maritimus]
MKDAGFKQDALYLIRPDSHLALATDMQWLPVLNMYLEAIVKGCLKQNEVETLKEARGINPWWNHSSSLLSLKNEKFTDICSYSICKNE